MKEDENGWFDAPAAKKWICPECGYSSPVVDWTEVEVPCHDCGSHDGRECPVCGESFDHVWGAERIKSGDPE